ncbi:hypothetical protein TUM20984_29520 [Mycobacterium antarcticum]|nr:hypothetical protein TUM20984_29520 [Mycolicibacterium sp. TUM20984]
MQFAAAAIRDLGGAMLGRDPYLVSVVAERGEVAVFTEQDARSAISTSMPGPCSTRSVRLKPTSCIAIWSEIRDDGSTAACQ